MKIGIIKQLDFFFRVLKKHYWIIPVLLFLIAYRGDKSWYQLPTAQFVNHTLTDKDSILLPMQKGYYYLKVAHNLDIQKPVLLDIIHSNVADFLVNGTPLNPEIVEYRRNRVGYQKHFVVPINPTDSIKIRLSIFKTDTTKHIIIRLITIDSFRDLKAQLYFTDRATNLFIMLMLGAFLLQVIYVVLLAFSRMRVEYFFYFLYCFEYTRLNLLIFEHQLGLNLQFLLQPNSIFFSTMILFIANTGFIKFLFRDFYLPQAYAVEGIAFLNLIFYALFCNNPIAQNDFASIGFLILYFSSVLLIYPLFLITDKAKYYILVGSLIVLISAIISRMMFIFYPEAEYDHYVIRMLTYLLDFMLLNAVLNYRNNQEKREQQLKLQNERNRIASEMHDDIGAGLSTIRLLSEMAQKGLGNLDKRLQIERIVHQSNDLIENLSTIIWAMNSRNDTIESLIIYLRRYAFEYIEPIGLNCHFELPDIPPSVSATILKGEIRRQVFLTFKEALHNIIKHAEATDVDISIQFQDSILEIIISDNGKGITDENPLGNGLKNMKERMALIGGSFSIFIEKNKSTSIDLKILINKS